MARTASSTPWAARSAQSPGATTACCSTWTSVSSEGLPLVGRGALDQSASDWRSGLVTKDGAFGGQLHSVANDPADVVLRRLGYDRFGGLRRRVDHELVRCIVTGAI